jgi:hypothetical protein
MSARVETRLLPSKSVFSGAIGQKETRFPLWKPGGNAEGAGLTEAGDREEAQPT